jgi:hypothetical protein
MPVAVRRAVRLTPIGRRLGDAEHNHVMVARGEPAGVVYRRGRLVRFSVPALLRHVEERLGR